MKPITMKKILLTLLTLTITITAAHAQGFSSSGVSLPVAVSDGGTGSTTAVNARTALGAAASGANTDITSLTLRSAAIQPTTDVVGLSVRGKSSGQTANVFEVRRGSDGYLLVYVAGEADPALHLWSIEALSQISAAGLFSSTSVGAGGGAVVMTAEGGLNLTGQTAPASPASGHWIIYVDTADSKLKAKNSAGTVRELAVP